MLRTDATLASPQSIVKMTSRQKKRASPLPCDAPSVGAHERLYIKALEQEFIEQRLRVQLYQILISEALGVDILRKIGVHRSRP